MDTFVANRRDVVDRIRGLASTLRAHGVRRLALFGSFMRDTQRTDSDIDVLVEFLPGKKTFDNFFAIGEILEETLGRRIELLTPESLSPHIGPQILHEAEDVLVAD